MSENVKLVERLKMLAYGADEEDREALYEAAATISRLEGERDSLRAERDEARATRAAALARQHFPEVIQHPARHTSGDAGSGYERGLTCPGSLER